VILIFPGEDQFLFSGVGGLPTSSSYCHILVGRTDGHCERLVEVGLVCGDGDVDVHVSDDAVSEGPVALLVCPG